MSDKKMTLNEYRLKLVRHKDNSDIAGAEDEAAGIQAAINLLDLHTPALLAGMGGVLRFKMQDESYFDDNAGCSVPSFSAYIGSENGWSVCVHTVEACLNAREYLVKACKSLATDCNLTAEFVDEEDK